MTELESQNTKPMIVNLGERLARGFLRKLFRIRGHENFLRNAYKAPLRYLRGCFNLVSRERRRARRPIINTPWPVDTPMVSVIIPCFNYGHYVKETLQSILNSTWKDLEVIVVEGGSTDGTTPDVVRSLEGGKVRCIYQTRRCYECENRFFGLQHVRGKYILFLDADDMIDPCYIENAVYLLETTGVDVIVPSVRLFATPQELEDAVQRRVGRKWDPIGLAVPETFEHNTAPGTSMFRYSFWKEHDIGMCVVNSYAPDWDFWMRLVSHGARYIRLPEPYHIYRQHTSNITLSFDESTRAAHMEMVRKRFEHIRLDENRLEDIRYFQAQRPPVHNPSVNLQTRSAGLSHGELNILVTVPWFDNYGVSVLLGNIFSSLTDAGANATIVGTNLETDPMFLKGVERFLAFTKDCFYLETCLPEANKGDFLAHIVRSRKIDVVLNNGSRLTYEMLGRLCAENPNLCVIDHLFNTTGHVANNREFADQIDMTIVVNDDIRTELMRRGELSQRIRLIVSGIDIDRFQPSRFEHPETRGNLLTLGYLGRFSAEKRPLDIVEMACRFPQLRFLMAGEGHLHSQAKQAIRKNDLGDRIQLLGYHRSKLEFFDMIDALIVPSEVEGLPIALLEAMALRKPVIATQAGMIPQVVQDGENGFIYSAGDLDALANKLQALANLTPERWLALGQRARATVLQNHSLARCSAEYLTAFRQLVQQRVQSPITRSSDPN